MSLHQLDWLVSGVLQAYSTRCTLRKLREGTGVHVGRGTYSNDGLVEVNYGLTLHKFDGEKEADPAFYWYKEMAGIYLGEKGFERKLFIKMPEDMDAQYPSLKELAEQISNSLKWLREGTAEIEDLERRMTSPSERLAR
jgi:hypothetical protein